MTKKNDSKEDEELQEETNVNIPEKVQNKLTCGIVMPIASMGEYSSEHWLKVKRIIIESVEKFGFKAKLVSDADEARVIHGTIIDNLYNSDVVVCDVSGKNPNVMFELGIRLAFDKPTIIIKDKKTGYSFDTSSIEHIEYPSDLSYYDILDFKDRLGEKVSATYEAYKNPNCKTFLKHFGQYKIAKLDEKEISGQDFILKALESMQFEMTRFRNEFNNYKISSENTPILETHAFTYNSKVVNVLLKKYFNEFLHKYGYEENYIKYNTSGREEFANYLKTEAPSGYFYQRTMKELLILLADFFKEETV